MNHPSMTPAQAAAAFEHLRKLAKPWHGMRLDGGKVIEFVCTACNSKERHAIDIGDAAMYAVNVDFVTKHQHPERGDR